MSGARAGGGTGPCRHHARQHRRICGCARIEPQKACQGDGDSRHRRQADATAHMLPRKRPPRAALPHLQQVCQREAVDARRHQIAHCCRRPWCALAVAIPAPAAAAACAIPRAGTRCSGLSAAAASRARRSCRFRASREQGMPWLLAAPRAMHQERRVERSRGDSEEQDLVLQRSLVRPRVPDSRGCCGDGRGQLPGRAGGAVPQCHR